jgi:hypothetical protein
MYRVGEGKGGYVRAVVSTLLVGFMLADISRRG